jgi:hypothetical protein
MTPAIVSIPIAILIFDNDGQIIYRAFSPTQYHTLSEPVGEDDDTFPDQFGQFLARIYSRISYDSQQALNNNTNSGKLKEVHTRMIDVPLGQRTNLCYFSTYTHPHTLYKPVHRPSPVFFNFQDAVSYGNSEPTLIHRSCSHEFV